MKTTLKRAKETAAEFSAAAPDLTVRVMDKCDKQSVVTASEAVYRERVLDGYVTVAIYKGGVQV